MSRSEPFSLNTLLKSFIQPPILLICFTHSRGDTKYLSLTLAQGVQSCGKTSWSPKASELSSLLNFYHLVLCCALFIFLITSHHQIHHYPMVSGYTLSSYNFAVADLFQIKLFVICMMIWLWLYVGYPSWHKNCVTLDCVLPSLHWQSGYCKNR